MTTLVLLFESVIKIQLSQQLNESSIALLFAPDYIPGIQAHIRLDLPVVAYSATD